MKIVGADLKKVEAFQEEKDKFYLLSAIATAENPLLISDKETYIMGRSDIGFPTWIWSKNNLPIEKVFEIMEALQEYLQDGENKFTCKKELYNLLKKEYDTENYFEMGYLSCKEAIKPLKRKGIFVRPNYGDKVTLAEYWRDNVKEMYGKQIPQKEALEEVERWFDEKKFFVLKDSRGEIVSMAGYSIIDQSAKITHVYTPKNERGKGYCQYLIYSLSKKLLEEGYTPLLYTDYHYKASNEAYKRVGFQDEGILINFSINREKKKEQQK